MFKKLGRPSNADLRKKNVEALLTNTDFQVTAKEFEKHYVVQRGTLSLQILLGPEFPNTPPTLVTVPPVAHPWISTGASGQPPAGTVTGAPLLARWRSDAADALFRAVREVLFELAPPSPQASPAESPRAAAGPPAGPAAPQPGPPRPNLAAGPPGGPAPLAAPQRAAAVGVPEYDTIKRSMGVQIDALPLFQSTSPATYSELLNDEDAFAVYFRQLDAVKSMAQAVTDMRATNAAQAQGLLAKKDKLAAQQDRLETQRELLTHLRQQLADAGQAYQKRVNRFEGPQLRQRLQALVQDSDAASTSFAESFVNQTVSADEFVQMYVDMRRQYHGRAIRLAKVEADAYVLPVFPQLASLGGEGSR